MIDFHSHILPGIDDGARDVGMALKMLKAAYNDGIDTVVSTSHIYIGDESDIDEFLQRRNYAFDELQNAMAKSGGKYPEIRLGCEVHVKPHIGKYDSVAKLAIQGTDYILLEMPYSQWKQEHYEAVYNITTLGVKPVMAHIERFMRYRQEFYNLKSLGAVFQVNADSFLHKPMRKTLLQLYYDGYVHLLGSDMHNMDDRQNRLKDAYDIINTRFGSKFAEFSEKNAAAVLANQKLTKQDLPQLGFFDKLKL